MKRRGMLDDADSDDETEEDLAPKVEKRASKKQTGKRPEGTAVAAVTPRKSTASETPPQDTSPAIVTTTPGSSSQTKEATSSNSNVSHISAADLQFEFLLSSDLFIMLSIMHMNLRKIITRRQ